MTTDQRFALFAINQRARPILGLNGKHGTAVQIAQMNAAFDVRLDDVVINFIAQVRTGSEVFSSNASRIKGLRLFNG